MSTFRCRPLPVSKSALSVRRLAITEHAYTSSCCLSLATNCLFPSTNLLSLSLLQIKKSSKTLNRASHDMMGLLDLEKHFTFYGAYHSNPINVIIHIIFVWPNVFSSLLLLHSATPIFDPSQLGFSQSVTFDAVLRFNVGFVFTVVYALFYICLDKKSGFLAALMCFSCWVGSSFVAARLGTSLAFKVGLVTQLVCWTGQFLGHGLFEKRAPALLDNLVQAFLMAPFFVLLEVLHSVFGYEPYPGFQARVNAKVESDIKEWREKKSKKIT